MRGISPFYEDDWSIVVVSQEISRWSENGKPHGVALNGKYTVKNEHGEKQNLTKRNKNKKQKRKPPQRLKVLDEVEAAASLAVWSATIGGALHYDLSPAYSL